MRKTVFEELKALPRNRHRWRILIDVLCIWGGVEAEWWWPQWSQLPERTFLKLYKAIPKRVHILEFSSCDKLYVPLERDSNSYYIKFNPDFRFLIVWLFPIEILMTLANLSLKMKVLFLLKSCWACFYLRFNTSSRISFNKRFILSDISIIPKLRTLRVKITVMNIVFFYNSWAYFCSEGLFYFSKLSFVCMLFGCS